MLPEDDKLTQPDSPETDLPEIVKKIRAQTPARLLAGRSGAAYRTNTQLELREAHAAARDAVRAELNFLTNLGDNFVRKWNLFEVCSQATTKDEYLLRPDLGRHLNDASRTEVTKRCITGHDLQIVIGDGLSVTAVTRQIPRLLPLICEGAHTQGWSVGEIFVIRHCRVGKLDEYGSGHFSYSDWGWPAHCDLLQGAGASGIAPDGHSLAERKETESNRETENYSFTARSVISSPLSIIANASRNCSSLMQSGGLV